jgi:predicted porin
MKKTSLVMLALCAGLPMMAQAPGSLTVTSANGDSSFQFYGILDLAVGKIAHSASFNDNYGNSADPRPLKYSTTSVTGMINGGISGDRFGFRGSTKISDDFKAIFTLESAINLNSGQVTNAVQGLTLNSAGTAAAGPNMYSADSSVSGQLFSRAAFFGVSSDTYGTLTAGRNTSFMLDLIPGYDPLNGAQMFTPIGYSGVYGGGGLTDDSRADNSLKYRVKIGGLNLGALYKFGDTAGSSYSRTMVQLNAGYEMGPFGIQAAYEGAKDATSLSSDTIGTAAVPGSLKATFYDTTCYMLTARYQLGALAIRAGYTHQEFTNPSEPQLDGQLTNIYGFSIGAWVTNPLNPASGYDQTKKFNVWWGGVNYDVTKQFNVAVGYYKAEQPSYAGTSGDYTAMGGQGDFGSLLLDYHFTSFFDVYLGYMGVQYKGAMAVAKNGTPPIPFDFASNHITAIGMRYMF